MRLDSVVILLVVIRSSWEVWNMWYCYLSKMLVRFDGVQGGWERPNIKSSEEYQGINYQHIQDEQMMK